MVEAVSTQDLVCLSGVQILRFNEFRDSGISPEVFPRFSSGNPEKTPARAVALLSFQSLVWGVNQKIGAERFTFWDCRPPGGVRVFQAKGWGSKSSFPPSKAKENTLFFLRIYHKNF